MILLIISNQQPILTSLAVQQDGMSQDEFNHLVIDSIQDIKGKRIVQLDLRKLPEASADYFIICEGESNTQVKAIADNIQKRARNEAGIRATHVEGERQAHWVCIDFFDIIVHVFYKDARKFYNLENLWSDAESREFDTI